MTDALGQPLISATRWCFEKDDDGHWYLIPHSQLRNWQKWLDSEDENEMGKYRIDNPHRFTFEIPKEDAF